MSEIATQFAKEINASKNTEKAPIDTTDLTTDFSSLSIRRRGCFIVECKLTSPNTGNKIDVLHADPDISIPKLTASHIMSPVGPNEGIGGQHGFPRWADYHEFAQHSGNKGEKRVALQAMRPDNGLGITKVFELGNGASLTSDTIIYNSEADPIRTSLGEHYYFALSNENLNGLRVDGKSLDDLLSKNAESEIMSGTPLFWSSFDGEVEINFPAGHSIRLSTNFTVNSNAKMGMLIWHRPGNPSICFEPTVGFEPDIGQSSGIELPPYSDAVLYSKIELL